MKLRLFATLLLLLCAFGVSAQSREVAGTPGSLVGVDDPNAPVWSRPTGAVLYNNGPLINVPGSPARSRLQTGTLGMTVLGFAQNSAGGFRMADEFVVPPGPNWLINSITFFGYQTGSPTTSTFTGLNFQIWNGAPNLVSSTVVFGNTTTNRLTTSTFSNIYRDTETTTTDTTRPIMANECAGLTISLAPGTYWLDWGSTGSLASGPWAPPITITGTAVTGNGLQSNAGVWAAIVDGAAGAPAQGLPFIIEGVAGVAPVITSGAPGQAIIGQPYTFTFTATGTAPITWSVTAGTLPPGLTLSAAGVLSGTPTTPGTSNFTVTATNAAGTANRAVVFGVGAALIPVSTLNVFGLLALTLALFAAVAFARRKSV